jgi:hypothetical protein
MEPTSLFPYFTNLYQSVKSFIACNKGSKFENEMIFIIKEKIC